MGDDHKLIFWHLSSNDGPPAPILISSVTFGYVTEESRFGAYGSGWARTSDMGYCSHAHFMGDNGDAFCGGRPPHDNHPALVLYSSVTSVMSRRILDSGLRGSRSHLASGKVGLNRFPMPSPMCIRDLRSISLYILSPSVIGHAY